METDAPIPPDTSQSTSTDIGTDPGIASPTEVEPIVTSPVGSDPGATSDPPGPGATEDPGGGSESAQTPVDIQPSSTSTLPIVPLSQPLKTGMSIQL